MKQLSYLNKVLIIFSILILLISLSNEKRNSLFAQTNGGPDEYGYTWRSSDDTNGPSYSWDDISATGTDLGLGDDESSAELTIGNGGFYFYGTDYSGIFVGDNGWVNFLEEAATPSHPFIPVNTEPNALLSPFGEDLNSENGNVFFQDFSDRFVIQYEQVPRFYNSGTNSFQIILDKTDSTIVFNYKTSDDWNFNSGTGTAITGIEDENGTSGLNIENSILTDNFAIKFYQPAPYIHYEPEEITFDDIWVGQPDSVEITLLNSGKSDLTISSISFENGTGFSFVDMSSMPMTINQVNSGDFEKFYVKFNPLSEGSYPDSVIIISNSNDENETLKIPITASAVQSDITMVTPSIDFGNVQIEYSTDDTKDMNIIIRNDGNAGLIIDENTSLTTGTFFEIISMPSSLPFTVLPSTQDTIVVRFTPLNSAIYNDVLEIHSNSPGEELINVSMTGTGVESEITFNPEILNFDSTVQGQTETKSFRITNSGDYKLTVTSMYLKTNESFSIPNHSSSFILQPGEFTDVEVDFTPIGVGSVVDSVAFITNLPDNYFVEVNGDGILPNLVTTPSNLNFGHLLLNETKIDSVVLSNTGIGDLIIDNIFLTDGDRYTITSSISYPFTLAPSDEYTVEIEFTPIYLGYVFDNLKIQSNIGEETVVIQGKGIFPDIEISQTHYNFGEVQVNESKLDSLYITNNGDADLEISAFNFDNGTDYSMVDLPTLPITISPATTEKVYIQFSPNSSQLLNDKITIVSNSLNNEEITLTGNGTYPGISFDPVIIEFDSTLENTSSNEYFWIKNTGNEVLNITTASILPVEFELFIASTRVNRDLSFTIPEGDSTRIRVQFIPTSNILYSGEITIVEETLGTSYIPVSGQGTRATLELSSNTLNFGDQSLNNPVSSNITLSSIGNGKLVINSFANSLDEFLIIDPPDLPLNLYPGNSVDIEIEFNPTEFITYNDSIIINNNSSEIEKILEINGNGVGGALELANDEIDFGNTNISQTSTDSVFIRNIGNQDLTVTSLSLSQNSDIFTVVSPLSFPLTINANDSSLVKVIFVPDAVENYTSILSIQSDDVLAAPNEIELTGNGVSADIFLSPSHLEYGNVHINDTVLDSVSIINTGNADLIITALNFNNGNYFSLENVPSFPLTIPMSSSYKIHINYSASIMGTVVDELNIVNNSISNVKVNLSGIGSLGNLISTESQLNFGSIDVGESNRFDFYIKNNGDYEIEVENMYVTAGGGFEINDEFFNPMISAGDSTSIGITFSPESHISYFSFLVIESEVDNLNIELSGIGLRAYLNAIISEYNFGNVNISSGAISDLITLENTGNKELTITDINFAIGTNFSYSDIDLPFILNSGENTTFTASFNPELPIDYMDSLQVINTSVALPVINLSGHGLGSNLNLSTTMLNYSEVEIGEVKLDTLTISNTGNSILTVDSIYITNETAFSIQSISGGGNLPLNIDIGEEEIVIIQFEPLNVTGYNSSIKLVSDSYDNSIDYCNLLGFGISANIALTPGLLDYSIVKVGEVFTKFFNISNTGNSTLIIEGLDFTEGTGYEFYETYSFPFSINPSENVSIGIDFIPSSNIIYGDTLIVVNNANNGVFLTLHGEGGLPELDVNLNSLEFGDILVNGSSLKQFIIRNNGNYLGHINELSNSDNHYQLSISSDKKIMHENNNNSANIINNNRFSLNIPANDSVIVDVNFTPSGMITYDDVIDIDGEFENFEVALSGTGVKAISYLSETVMDFGSVQVQTTELDTLTITNMGNTNLVIDSFFVVNTNAFEIIDFENFVFPVIIQPNNELEVMMEFSPQYLTNYSNRIKILSNNFENSTQYLYLIGSGEALDMVITPTLLDYEMVNLGSAATKSFRITNNGSENIIINELENDLSVFSIINAPNLPYTLTPTEQIYINVRFLPVTNIVYNDTLDIVTNSVNGNVVLAGIGAMASFELSENILDFDSVYVNNTTVKSFYIVNEGTAELNIDAISLNLPEFKFFTADKSNKKRSFFVIDAHDSLEIYVSFTPTEAMIFSDLLTIESDIGTKTVDLLGKGAIPLLNLSAYNLEFEDTEVYTEAADSIIVRNDMSLPVSISSMVFTNNSIFNTIDLSFPAEIPANDSITIKIKFVPNEISHFNSELHIVNNSGINPVVELSGSGYSDDLVLSKLHKDFGNVSVGDELLDTLNILNSSGNTIIFNNLELVTGIHFNILSQLTIPYNLLDGDDIDIEYSISPQFFSSNTLVDTIKLNTSLTDAKIILSGISQNIDLAISETLINFDSVYVDSTANESITLTNNGLGRILIEDISLLNGNPFTIDHQSLDFLLPDQSMELTTIFSPTEIGTYSDSIVININGPSRYISLFGIGKEGVGIEGNNYELRITNYELKQNYPNPFNNSTKIDFSIPKENRVVTLKLFNSKGELIKNIIYQKNYNTGYHSQIIDMSKYSTGIYYYGIYIQNEKYNKVRKMILLK